MDPQPGPSVTLQPRLVIPLLQPSVLRNPGSAWPACSEGLPRLPTPTLPPQAPRVAYTRHRGPGPPGLPFALPVPTTRRPPTSKASASAPAGAPRTTGPLPARGAGRCSPSLAKPVRSSASGGCTCRGGVGAPSARPPPLSPRPWSTHHGASLCSAVDDASHLTALIARLLGGLSLLIGPRPRTSLVKGRR